MAASIMVVTEFNEQLIRAGAKLTRRLEKTLTVSAAFWLFQADSVGWRLMIASPDLERLGPKEVYTRIQQALKKKVGTEIKLSLDEITLVPETHSILALLRTAIRTGEGISGIRFSRNTVNGHFIEDAYIYRV